MLCRNPFQKGVHLYPCGQCMPCRLNRRRIWTHRLMLESLLHPASAFITLTYSDQHLPLTSAGLPTLNPKHLQDWLKRFRKAIQPSLVRFYAVGEYGEQSERPHYHVAMFNFPSCLRGRSAYSYRANCCPNCDLVRDTWKLGQVDLGELNVNSSQYLCGYVTKKMTKQDDSRLKGRVPEFARMSNRPGIGADALHDVASTLLQFGLEVSQGDVPSALRHGGRLLPLGRYLRRRLRVLVGKDENAPESTLREIDELLRPLRETSRAGEVGPLADARFKAAVIEAADGKVARMESRNRIFKKRGNL